MKKYTRKKSGKYQTEKQAKDTLKGAVKSFNWKLAGVLAISFIAIFGIYQAAIYLQFKHIMTIYMIITLLLIIVYSIYNRGFSRHSPTINDLPKEWSEKKKIDYVNNDINRKRKAKKLLIFIIPFLLTFMIDFIYLFYVDGIINKK